MPMMDQSALHFQVNSKVQSVIIPPLISFLISVAHFTPLAGPSFPSCFTYRRTPDCSLAVRSRQLPHSISWGITLLIS